jgi:hypothetical protein
MAYQSDVLRGSLLAFETGLIEQQERIGLRQRWMAAHRGRIESHAQSEWRDAEARLTAYKVRWSRSQAQIKYGFIFWVGRPCERRKIAQQA